MAVPAAASGRTKGSGKLAGAGLGSRRSPESRAGALRESSWGPRSRRLRCLSRRGSSRPALSPPLLPPQARDAEAGAGPLGFFRNELGSCRTGARLRLAAPTPTPTPDLDQSHQTLSSAGPGEASPARRGIRLLPEHLRQIGEQGPALGSGRRARPHRSATSGMSSSGLGQPRPVPRLFP